jgi:hypothetical protein
VRSQLYRGFADMDPRSVPLEQLDTLWDYDDPTESERRFEALLVRARTERHGAYLAETLTQLARAQGFSGASTMRGGRSTRPSAR